MNLPPACGRGLFLGGAAVLLVACSLFGLSCSSGTTPSGEEAGTLGSEPNPAPAPGQPWFVDVTAAAGIDFRHFDSRTSMHYLTEVMGSGVAWIDFDNDGWPVWARARLNWYSAAC